ncbi:hypothetical protein QLG07_02130, partial [Erwinia sp. V90_4]|uniref:hypothetical protein n=1 Tax=Erwinia sp. V90_4 TaxID=3044239 RepID=UPI00249E00E9
MKRIQISEGKKPLCLMVPLLLSACHTAPHRPGLNDVAPAGNVPAEALLNKSDSGRVSLWQDR